MGHYSDDYDYQRRVTDEYKKTRLEKTLLELKNFRANSDRTSIPNRFNDSLRDLENYLIVEISKL